MIESEAYIRDKLHKGFILDDEKLLRIEAIIANRASAAGMNFAPTYKVYRSDGLVFSSQDRNMVVNEENSKSRRIRRLLIEAKSKEDANVELQISVDFSKYGTDINIEGNRKDLVDLLYLDLYN